MCCMFIKLVSLSIFKMPTQLPDDKINVLKEHSLTQIPKPEKAAGIGNLPGRFLKDGAVVLALAISKLCSLLTKHLIFPYDCRIAKRKPLYKK